MPSGNTHDAITFLLTVPAAAAVFYVTDSLTETAVVSTAFLFGGLMFGPDLDTVSKQYARWGIFRLFWYPYRMFFRHRSRWSHGLVFGTFFRVIYFMGVATLVLFAASYCSALVLNTAIPKAADLAGAWSGLGRLLRIYSGGDLPLLLFAGMWVGAATHTFSDMAVTYVKTGRTTGFL